MIADILFTLYIIAVIVMCFICFSHKYNLWYWMDRYDLWSIYWKVRNIFPGVI